MKWRSGQSVVKQDSAVAISYPDAAERGKAWRKAIIICGRIDDRGAGDGSNIRDTGGLVRSHSGAEQVWNSNRGDDQYDGHDDEEFDQRKTASSVPFRVRIVILLEHFLSLY